MIIEKRLISELQENSINTRRHNTKQIEEFKKSIEKFDVIRPIVIDENNVILAGNGLYLALRSLGRKDADVIVMKGLSEKDKKKLLLTDNKIYSLGVDDFGAIESILRELASDSDFEVPGYDADILEELYGIRSVENSVETNTIEYTPDFQADNQQYEKEIQDIQEFTPDSNRIQSVRQAAVENRKFIVCPNCGEKIWL